MSVLRASELVGRVVGKRYRLLRPIGSGASAHVYVAEDVRLRRRIALKVLHPALASDRLFLRRFEAEAQIVASLRHPGIVRVYDWGEGTDEAYLVMELLDGGSLRALMDTGYRLSVSQAAALGLDIAAALAYAHSRGLVHRDIKPANLLFDEEGHASVADFGIARALAEASWTEPVGGLMGTARYAAPEQLRGQPLDGKADVYSLGLVLIEAVTGEVPFSLDTALAGLIARATAPLPVPGPLEVLVPVVQGATELRPEDRTTAEALGQEIASLAGRLSAPARLPVSASLRNALTFSASEGAEPTDIGNGRARPAGAELSVLVGDVEVTPEAFGAASSGGLAYDDGHAGQEGAPEPASALMGAALMGAAPIGPEPPVPVRPEPGPVGPAPAAAGPAPVLVATGPEEPGRRSAPAREGRGRPRRRWVRPMFVVALVLLLCAGAGAAVYLEQPPPPPPTYRVPSLTGDRLSTAGTSLANQHLSLSVTGHQWSAAAPSGIILSQYPVPGTRLLAYKSVEVTVSLGPEPVAVPSLATLDLAQAHAFLSGAGLRLGHVSRQTSMTVVPSEVISWFPRAHKVLPGTAVNVVISLGKPMATVPTSADGSAFTTLAAQLRALGFAVQDRHYYNDSVPAGHVISVVPPAGSKEVVGTSVLANISLGPHLVTLPSSLVGLPVLQAAKVLSGLGLYVSRVSGSPLLPVHSTVPSVGQAVLYGSSITLVT